MKKLDILFILFTLLLSISVVSNVSAEKAPGKDTETEVNLVSEDGEDIALYNEISDEESELAIPADTVVVLLERMEDYSKIRYIENEDNSVEGYVETKHIADLEQNNEQTNVNEENETQNNAPVQEEQEKLPAKDKQDSNEASTDKGSTATLAASTKTLKSATGVALKATTYVYKSQSTTSKKLKGYARGSVLKYKLLNDQWYEASVKINGKYVTGYIKATDVDHTGGESVTLNGYAIKGPTKVYKNTTDESALASVDVLKTYEIGSKLKYRTYSENWYEATVYINGVKHTGYIQKADVDEKIPTLQGYAQDGKTIVYASASKGSKQLKSYLQGQLLKYRPYNNSWYEATVYISGKKHTGYIHKDDVGSDKPALQGYAQLTATAVYADTSKSSKVLKDYPAGQLLKFKEYNSTWYEATVYIKGVKHTGYIYKKDVDSSKPSFNGYAQLEATSVYSSTSTASKVLKSYNAGTVLKYRPYNSNWYEATVYVSGKKQVGYIYADDVADSLPTLTGIANKASTAVYSSASKGSSVLKSYKKGSLLKYQPYNNDWYKAKVFISGKAHTGYIHRGDVVQPIGKTIVIDAGHGGHDPGASGNGLREKDITLDMALRTAEALKKSGFNVIMTRTTDEFLQLSQRTNIANGSGADLFLSIHVNSGGGTGVETWWYSKGPKASESKEFAQNIQNEVIKETKVPNRGIKDGNLHINRESNMPSSLIEIGFVDHPNDAAKMKQNSYKNSIVKGIVSGIKKYLKIP